MFLRPRFFSGVPAPARLSVIGLIAIVGLSVGGMLANALLSRNGETWPPERTYDRSASGDLSGMRLPADVLRVVDGDTFEARVRAWPGIDITTRVRLRGIDAPEMSANCREEAIKAEAARSALQSILAQGGVAITRVAPDKYGGRVVADASTRTTADVSAAMLDRGHARRYDGGRRQSWCG